MSLGGKAIIYIIYLNIIFHVRYKPIEHKFFDDIITVYVDNHYFERHYHYLSVPSSLWFHETVQQALMFCWYKNVADKVEDVFFRETTIEFRLAAYRLWMNTALFWQMLDYWPIENNYLVSNIGSC
jgi:hypothetical protein